MPQGWTPVAETPEPAGWTAVPEASGGVLSTALEAAKGFGKGAVSELTDFAQRIGQSLDQLRVMTQGGKPLDTSLVDQQLKQLEPSNPTQAAGKTAERVTSFAAPFVGPTARGIQALRGPKAAQLIVDRLMPNIGQPAETVARAADAFPVAGHVDQTAAELRAVLDHQMPNVSGA